MRVELSGYIGTVLVAILAAGCGKKGEPAGAASPPDSHASATASPTTPQGVPAAAGAPSSAADARLSESEAAVKARQYDQAVEALAALQQQRLTEQQAAVVAAQMRQLQSDLAAGVANGDPRAKAAADRLRRSAKAR